MPRTIKRQSRRLKPHLEAAVDDIQGAVADGVDPEELEVCQWRRSGFPKSTLAAGPDSIETIGQNGSPLRFHRDNP